MRYRVAALFSDLIYPFQRDTFHGIAFAAAENDLDLVCITCGVKNNPDTSESMRNVLYDMIDPSKYDGFIIPFSSLGQYLSQTEFCESLGPLLLKPSVLFGVEIEGYSCVTPDYEKGMSKLIHHLVEDHNAERFVFVRGPATHMASNIRENGFYKALKDLNMSEDCLTVIKKHFLSENAGEVLTDCEDAGLIHPRCAMVFAGDNIALGMLNEMNRRGYSIPSDIMVCGTSETIDNRQCNPSLTSVDNHFDNIGSMSVDLLLKHLKEGYSPLTLRADVDIIRRKSCGCIPLDDKDVLMPERIYALGSYLEKKDGGKISDSLNLFGDIHKHFPGDKDRYFFSALSSSLNGFKTHMLSESEPTLYNHLHLFREIGNSLISDFDLNSLFRNMKDNICIQHCFLSEYDRRGKAGSRLRLVQAYRMDEKNMDAEKFRVFDSSDFFPKDVVMDCRTTFIVEPLFYEKKQLGILAVDYSEINMLVHEALRGQIAGALENRNQHDEIVAARERFDDMAHMSSDWLWETDADGKIIFSSGGIDNIMGYSAEEMTGRFLYEFIIFESGGKAFFEKLFLLRKNFQNRVEVESRSRNGARLVFEFSAKPICDSKGTLRGFRGECKDITAARISSENLQKLLGEKEMLLRELYHRTKNNMQVICSLMGIQTGYCKDDAVRKVFKDMEYRIRTMSLVHEKLYQSKDLSRINMREYIQDLVLLLCAGYRKSMGTIALKMDDMDEVYVLIDTAIPCGMIINELISNSFKYAFPDDRSGEIRIELTQTSDGEICLKMSDDGIGVAEGYDLRKQGGMGVKIAFALAESQLSGRMTLDCKKGIRFTLIFKDVFYKQRI